MVDTVQNPSEKDQLRAPISHYLQNLFAEDIPMAERVDWKAKSNQFLEDLARGGLVISSDHESVPL